MKFRNAWQSKMYYRLFCCKENRREHTLLFHWCSYVGPSGSARHDLGVFIINIADEFVSGYTLSAPNQGRLTSIVVA